MAQRNTTWEQGVTDYLGRLEATIKEVNGDVKALRSEASSEQKSLSERPNDFKIKYTDEVGSLKTQVKIYAGIASAIGLAALGLAMSALFGKAH